MLLMASALELGWTKLTLLPLPISKLCQLRTAVWLVWLTVSLFPVCVAVAAPEPIQPKLAPDDPQLPEAIHGTGRLPATAGRVKLAVSTQSVEPVSQTGAGLRRLLPQGDRGTRAPHCDFRCLDMLAPQNP